MKVLELHSWQIDPVQAPAIQRHLAAKVSRTSDGLSPRLIAGMDISAPKADGLARAAVVILKYPELRVAEVKVVSGRLSFPYIAGLLSFREAPLTLAACERLKFSPDLIIVDGQGILHPRRFGLASHLGLLLDTPTIGCAKSRLCGEHQAPGPEPGDYAEVVDGGEVIGVALRTRIGVSPVYVSIGHRIDLEDAIYWVMQCCRGFRVPEATRLAHLWAGGNLREETVEVKINLQGRLFN